MDPLYKAKELPTLKRPLGGATESTIKLLDLTPLYFLDNYRMNSGGIVKRLKVNNH